MLVIYSIATLMFYIQGKKRMPSLLVQTILWSLNAMILILIMMSHFKDIKYVHHLFMITQIRIYFALFHKVEILNSGDQEVITILFLYGACNLVACVVNVSLYMSLISKHKFKIQILNILFLSIGMCAKLIGFQQAWNLKGKIIWPFLFVIIGLTTYLYITEKLD